MASTISKEESVLRHWRHHVQIQMAISVQICKRYSTPLALVGCNTIKTEHTVKITMDVNVKLDRELDDVFGELDELSASSETTPAETEKKD